MVMHRNKGAPFEREDGSTWERGAEAEPTQAELRQRHYKLRPIAPADRGPPPEGLEHIVPAAADGTWPLAMAPQRYEELHPNGQYAELARRLMAPESLLTEEQSHGDTDIS